MFDAWYIFFRFLRRIRYPYKKHIILLFLILLSTCIPLIEALILERTVDDAILKADITLLLVLITTMLFMVLVESAIHATYGWLSGALAPRLTLEIQRNLYAHIQLLPFGFFVKTPSGEVISRLVNDVETLEAFTTKTLPQYISDISIVCILLIGFAYFSWPLFFIIVPLCFLQHIFHRAKSKRIEILSQNNRQYIAKLQQFFNESIGFSYFVRILGLEKNRQKQHINIAKSYIRNNAKYVKLSVLLRESADLLPAFARLIIYGLGGWMVIMQTLTLGELLAVLYLFSLFEEPWSEMFKANVELTGLKPVLRRIVEYFELPTAHNGPVSFKEPLEHIGFHQVNYGYDTSKAIVNQLIFKARVGETIGIVGRSGGGKTTLVHLLIRLLNPDSGAIYINQTNIAELTAQSLTRLISVVPQELPLFNTSILNNLLYGKHNATEQEVQTVCEQVGLHTFINNLPQQYHTVVGEQGVRLSGGQKQKIAIARALLKQPNLLILDEATSHLDMESEQQVQAAIFNQGHSRRITFIIAHRLATVRNCDVILVLNEGHIVEQGNHAQLIANRGLYSQFWAIQQATGSTKPQTCNQGTAF